MSEMLGRNARGQPLFAEIGTVSGSCIGSADYDPVSGDKTYQLLSAAKYLTIQSLGHHAWTVVLTEFGKKQH
jgi:hypothetical protein